MGTVCEPAEGTGGFLLAAHQYVLDHFKEMDRDQKRHLKSFIEGWEQL